MKFNDTHLNEAALGLVDYRTFESGWLVDETDRVPQYLFRTYPALQSAGSTPAAACRDRLFVHVADAHAPGAVERVLDALGAEPMDVPF